jgi:phage repressor protein C with HTH and peptisase S24 domain
MLKHGQIWDAIDRLATEKGLTASGLARRAGLDPTTFNRSKRVSREGKARWPSTESIAKILEATDTPLDRFFTLLDSRATPHKAVPVTSLAASRGGALFDPSGRPAGSHWSEMPLPEYDDPKAFILEVSGSELEPIYVKGTLLFVSPAAPVRAGDRVFVRIDDGATWIGRFIRRDQRQVRFTPLPAEDSEVAIAEPRLVSCARILWAAH